MLFIRFSTALSIYSAGFLSGAALVLWAFQ